MIARIIGAQYLHPGDKVLDGAGAIQEIASVSFYDSHSGNGVWYTEQPAEEFEWAAPDEPLSPNDPVVVLRVGGVDQ